MSSKISPNMTLREKLSLSKIVNFSSIHLNACARQYVVIKKVDSDQVHELRQASCEIWNRFFQLFKKSELMHI